MVRMPARIADARPQAPARPVGDEGAGAGDRRGDRAPASTMFVTYLSNFDSLQRTRGRLLRDGARFADVFASLKRAPASLEPRIAAHPGRRGRRDARRRRRDARRARHGRAGDRPADLAARSAARPPLNDVYLRRGRWIDPSAARRSARQRDVLRGPRLRSRRSRRRDHQRPAAMADDRRRRAVARSTSTRSGRARCCPTSAGSASSGWIGARWRRRSTWKAASTTCRWRWRAGASAPEASSPALDRLIEPYGGLRRVPRSLQLSAWTLENELTQLQTFGFIMPLIFLGVAAFILNVALTRALALQRPQIAALKALGYSNRRAGLALHQVGAGDRRGSGAVGRRGGRARGSARR